MKITVDEILNQTVRVLTLNEPFASLMIHGKQETRSRITHVRGLVAIHTALKPFEAGKVHRIAGHTQYQRIQAIKPIENGLGMITSIGYLTGCKFMGDYIGNETSIAEIENRCFVQFNPELWIWEFDDVTPIVPIPWKGKQGWKTLTWEQKQLIQPL